MRLLIIFDGSDDGFEGLRIAATLLRSFGTNHEITLAIAGWPPRLSPIWDLAFERLAAVDDLHRAMAEVAATELQRLSDLFSPLGSIEIGYPEGDPVPELIALTKRSNPELVIAGLTRGERAKPVTDLALAIIEEASTPAFLTFGPSSPHTP